MIDPTNFQSYLGGPNGGRPAASGARRAEAFNSAPVSSPAGSSPAGNPAGAPVATPSQPFFQGDPLARLPGPARDRFRNFQSDVDAASAVIASLFDRLQEGVLERQKAENRLRALQSRNGPALAADDPSLVAARQKLAEAAADHDRIKAELDRRTEAARPLRELVAAIENYVARQLVGVPTIEPAAPVSAPQLRKGQTFVDAVNEARARLEKLLDDLAAVEAATLPAAEAKALARAQIAGLAERGRPNVLQLIEGRREFAFARRFVGADFAYDANGRPIGRAGRDGHVFDAEATFVWLHQPEITAAIERLIDEQADPSSALTDEQIQKKTGQLLDAIISTERAEESLIQQASKEGVLVQRRATADPRAILGLSDAMPPPRRLFI